MIIDSREPPEIIFKAKDLFNDSEVKSLETGDFYEEDIDAIFERKTIGDFIQSYKGNHIQKQLMMMQKHKYKFLIIAGTFFHYAVLNKYNNVTKNQYLGMLKSVLMRYDIRVIQVDSDDDLLLIMKMIIKEIKEDKVVMFYGENKFIEKKLKPYEQLLFLIPGINEKLVIRITSEYSNLNLLKDSINDKSFKINGIGEKKTQEIKNFISEL